jgi:diguanylate cyclase (GGDEF)-like protein/PAS domain S-box-containing protein
MGRRNAPRVRRASFVGVRRSRVSLTVLGTLLVVVGELLLLTAVYHRGTPTRQQRLVLATLSGQLQYATPGAAAQQAEAQTTLAIQQLRKDGLSATSLGNVGAARTALATDPADMSQLEKLRAAVTDLDQQLAARQHTIDNQAEYIYAALLITASLGWMIWFRRLVTRHRALQRQMTEQQAKTIGEHRLAALVRNAADVVAVCDVDSTVSFVTPSVRSVLGADPNVLLGQLYSDLIYPDDVDLFVHLVGGQRPDDEQALKLRMQHADGRLLHVEGTVRNLLADPSVNGLVITVRDVTARVQLEERLTHQAFHDPLTGLANRRLFADRLSHALERRAGLPGTHAVLFCDLDDFKNVNDSLGHGIGDQVLAMVGERVLSVVRTGDTASRLGGDEFAILMESTDLEEAQDVAERLQAALAEPVYVDGRSLAVRASIGLAQAVPGVMTSEEALRNADVAMYLAKDRGKSAIARYESRLHVEAMARLQLRADLQRALRRDELELHYQPTIDLTTEAIVGFEALVRWQHPDRGLLPPALFVPMAEESGLIAPLGSWVLRTACAAAVRMQSAAHQPTISVNVAAQQLSQAGFVQEVLGVLAETGLTSDRLCLEITESIVLQDLDMVASRLVALREHGIQIAIDDFGTGYSSLAYLSHLPVDVLKIDKSFIDRITIDQQDASLTEAIIAMSRTMRLSNVAEGVEDSDQAAWLLAAQCQYGQGYLWSRPVTLDRAMQLLDNPELVRSSPLVVRTVEPKHLDSTFSQRLSAAG